MKRILAVVFLLMSLASVAFADGGGGILPVRGTAAKLPQASIVQWADGPGLPPIK